MLNNVLGQLSLSKPSRPTAISYRVYIRNFWHRADSVTVSVRRACERSSVGHFIMLFFLATRFYSTISLLHDVSTIFSVDRHYVFRV